MSDWSKRIAEQLGRVKDQQAARYAAEIHHKALRHEGLARLREELKKRIRKTVRRIEPRASNRQHRI
jgi:hypothetical protein